ncbi:hypothetical protein [Rhodocyclus gracilis]|uniref:Uncharacterized protein n=1 Tax=Rhodocyclus tenuis TaxID=1066 RepID=A0A6L5JXQ2_RHOTE|nr:hypothetical protein [Rhodocyclus gracilis]MQY51811.1 hypothetical protein [Rhodocyclus gracilis]
MIVQSPPSVAYRYNASTVSPSTRQTIATTAAISADTVTLSAAARQQLASEQSASGSSRSATQATFDTDKGVVSLNVDDYLSSKLDSGTGELPPLLMPSQRNIDALNQYISSQLPGVLAAHGIPSAPAQITYDSSGQMQFPADYPYADAFKQALNDTPSLARAINWTSGLSSTKADLDRYAPFQEELQNATTTQAQTAIFNKYAALLSGSGPAPQVALHFDAKGQVSITIDGKAQTA